MKDRMNSILNEFCETDHRLYVNTPGIYDLLDVKEK